MDMGHVHCGAREIGNDSVGNKKYIELEWISNETGE